MDDVPESEESNLKKQIDTCISQVENDVSVGVEDNPQLCVTEKSVEETDKQEKFLMLEWGLYRTHKMVLRKSLLRRQINQKQNKVVLGLKITHKMVLWKSQLVIR